MGRRSPPVGGTAERSEGTSERSKNVRGTRRSVEELARRREPCRDCGRADCSRQRRRRQQRDQRRTEAVVADTARRPTDGGRNSAARRLSVVNRPAFAARSDSRRQAVGQLSRLTNDGFRRRSLSLQSRLHGHRPRDSRRHRLARVDGVRAVGFALGRLRGVHRARLRPGAAVVDRPHRSDPADDRSHLADGIRRRVPVEMAARRTVAPAYLGRRLAVARHDRLLHAPLRDDADAASRRFDREALVAADRRVLDSRGPLSCCANFQRRRTAVARHALDPCRLRRISRLHRVCRDWQTMVGRLPALHFRPAARHPLRPRPRTVAQLGQSWA